MKFDKYQIQYVQTFYLGDICTIEPDPTFISSEPIDIESISDLID